MLEILYVYTETVPRQLEACNNSTNCTSDPLCVECLMGTSVTWCLLKNLECFYFFPSGLLIFKTLVMDYIILGHAEETE